jgi:putative salt-induced outer membrane protein YdiY
MSRGSYAKLVGSYLCRAVAALCLCSSAFAFDAPRNLKAGWDGSLQLGALATFGAVDTNALLARTDFTYQGERWKLRDPFSIKLK